MMTTRKKYALRDEITASSRTLRHFSPSRLNILGLLAAERKFTPCLSAGSVLSVFFDVEIESRALKLNTMEGPGTLATRKSSLSIFDKATKRHDVNRYVQGD